MDWEPCCWWIARSVSPMVTPVSMRSRTAIPRLRSYRSVACFHVCPPIAFVCTDSSYTGSVRVRTTTRSMRECGGTFQFAKNLFFVIKKIAYEAVGMFFMHCQRRVGLGAKDTQGQVVGESRYIRLVCGRELNKTGKVSS